MATNCWIGAHPKIPSCLIHKCSSRPSPSSPFLTPHLLPLYSLLTSSAIKMLIVWSHLRVFSCFSSSAQWVRQVWHLLLDSLLSHPISLKISHTRKPFFLTEYYQWVTIDAFFLISTNESNSMLFISIPSHYVVYWCTLVPIFYNENYEIAYLSWLSSDVTQSQL